MAPDGLCWPLIASHLPRTSLVVAS